MKPSQGPAFWTSTAAFRPSWSGIKAKAWLVVDGHMDQTHFVIEMKLFPGHRHGGHRHGKWPDSSTTILHVYRGS